MVRGRRFVEVSKGNRCGVHLQPDRADHVDRERLIDVIRHDGPSVAAALVVGVVVTSALGALLLSVPAIERWDLRVVRDIADARSDLGATLTDWGTWLAETVPVAVGTFALMAIAWWRWRRWAPVVFVAAAVGGEKLIYLVSSYIVGRDRPDVVTLGDTYATNSFPSGHVASAVVLYGSAALLLGAAHGARWRRVGVVVTVVVVLVVATCRVYRGFHFVTDVLAGAALGATWLAFVWHRFGDRIVGHATDGSSTTHGSEGEQEPASHTIREVVSPQ